MSEVRDLHNEAMRFAQLAMVARNEGDIGRAEDFASQAFKLESRAAALIPSEPSAEPTRSILYRSAASLAYQARDFQTAKRMVWTGLSGNPPEIIRAELENLYEQIKFEDILQQDDSARLEHADLSVLMLGDVVGYGTIIYTEFKRRLDDLIKVIDRTVQRLMQRDYQDAGQVAKQYKPFTPAVQAPTQGSFSITIKLIRAEDLPQSNFFVPDAGTLIDEVITGIQLVNESDQTALRNRITDPRYYNNFITLVRDMAPDGQKIKLVKFSGVNNTAALTSNRQDIKVEKESIEKDISRTSTPIHVEGVLDFATARQAEEIGLTTADGKEYDIVAEEGMEDIVRNYFKELVVVTGTYDGKKIHLSDIHPPE